MYVKHVCSENYPLGFTRNAWEPFRSLAVFKSKKTHCNEQLHILSNKKLLGTSASLLVTSALLVVTKVIRNKYALF